MFKAYVHWKKKTFCGYICYKYIVQNNLCENLLTHRQFLEKWLPPNLLNKYLKYPRHNIEGSIVTPFSTDIYSLIQLAL